MKHKIRINGVIKKIDCELCTTFVADNGKEIFEGDRVRLDLDGSTVTDIVKFNRGEFWINGLPLSDVIFECNVTVLD